MLFWQKVAAGQFGSFDPVLVARSRVSATKCGPSAKIRGVKKKCICPNFQPWRIQGTCIKFLLGRPILENYNVIVTVLSSALTAI